MKLKKYHILLALFCTIWFLTMAIPQVTGTAFINNYKDLKPKDWLSGILIKGYKKNTILNHTIPENIKIIKLVGNNLKGMNYHIDIIDAIDKENNISYDFKSIIDFPIKDDTLVINIKSGYVNSFALAVDSSIIGIVIDGLSNPTIHSNQKNELTLSVQNKSDIIISGNTNKNIRHITVDGQSTLSLINTFTSIIDIEIKNSMVYIDYLNHIDSLKANLIGKSNIKKKEVTVWRDDAKNKYNESKKELNINDTHVNIYAKGNLEYFKNSQ